jgi:hypothetical protein
MATDLIKKCPAIYHHIHNDLIYTYTRNKITMKRTANQHHTLWITGTWYCMDHQNITTYGPPEHDTVYTSRPWHCVDQQNMTVYGPTVHDTVDQQNMTVCGQTEHDTVGSKRTWHCMDQQNMTLCKPREHDLGRPTENDTAWNTRTRHCVDQQNIILHEVSILNPNCVPYSPVWKHCTVLVFVY